MKIFIIGLPGSGKSTTGRQLAGALNLPFLDLDEEIERVSGQSIPALFQTAGEIEFRVTEANVLRSCIQHHPAFVMATGGGTPCFLANMEVMNSSGITLFLDTPVDEILTRLTPEEVEVRPLLAGSDPADRLRQLYEDRLPFYAKAQYRITHSDIPAIVRLLTIIRM